MPYPNGNRYDNRYQGGNTRNYQQREAPAPVPDFPENYVDFAEKLMERNHKMITTSKLRNFLSLLMDVYNTENLRTEETICPESQVKLQMARIRIAYECGRDENTKKFIDAAHLLPWLKAIGNSREKAIQYIHYLEAIVAYHRFFGGGEFKNK